MEAAPGGRDERRRASACPSLSPSPSAGSAGLRLPSVSREGRRQLQAWGATADSVLQWFVPTLSDLHPEEQLALCPLRDVRGCRVRF